MTPHQIDYEVMVELENRTLMASSAFVNGSKSIYSITKGDRVWFEVYKKNQPTPTLSTPSLRDAVEHYNNLP